jgi:glutaredoxin-like YruB-family protein
MSVKLYSTPTCGYCRIAKNYLKEKGISYTEYDVSRDQSKAEEMVRKTGQMGVPVLDINGRVIVGFDRGGIDRALAS